MKKKIPTLLNVYGEADGQSMMLGQLSYHAREISSAFQWSDEAVEAGIQWSPIHLPLSRKLWLSASSEIELMGLPGMIHDCLPDGWGMLLMDRAFGQAGIPSHEISPMLRLAFLADRCWGAIRFEPEWGSDIKKEQRVAMDRLSQEAQLVMEGDTEQVSRALLVAGGSPHGARPKVMVAVNDDTSRALVGYNQLPDGFRHVLIKFAGNGEDPTCPLLEFCYGEAARALGIETARAQMITAGGRDGLCLDRFDRQNGQRQHVHSMAGLLHTTHRIANSDWLQVEQLLRGFEATDATMQEALRRAIFNAVFCVRDDHTKNIAFMRKGRQWTLAPAFDLSYSDGPGGYHTMTYAHHSGQNVTHQDLLRLAQSFGVSSKQVEDTFEQAQGVRVQMLSNAKGMGVSGRLLKIVAKRFRDIDRDMKPAKTLNSKKPPQP